MKDHTFYSQEPTGEIVICWNDDAEMAQVVEWPNREKSYSPHLVVGLMKRAYKMGKDHKRDELLTALGIKE